MNFDATITNAITNFIHFIALIFYFYLAKKNNLNNIILSIFALICSLKFFGIMAHLMFFKDYHHFIWFFICYMVMALNMLFVHFVSRKKYILIIVAILSFILACLHLYFNNFIFTAISITLGQVISIFLIKNNTSLDLYYNKSLIIKSQILAILSNIIWILLNTTLQLTYNYLNISKDDLLLGKYSYHNDLYHFMLIASTLILFKALKN